MTTSTAPAYPIATAHRTDDPDETCEFCSLAPAPAVWAFYYAPAETFVGLVKSCEDADCYRYAQQIAFEQTTEPDPPTPVAECHRTYRSVAERAVLAMQAPAVAHQRMSGRWCTCNAYLPRDTDWHEHQHDLQDWGLIA